MTFLAWRKIEMHRYDELTANHSGEAHKEEEKDVPIEGHGSLH